MRIAHVSPLPPQQTGIADYCARLLPHLAEVVEMDVLGLPETAVSNFTIYPLAQLPERRLSYDLCLYHMGNHPAYHDEIYKLALRYPGVVVLHEVNLHGFFAAQSMAAYSREMGFAAGLTGVDQVRRVRLGGQQPPVNQYPLVDRIWQTSLGIIVHTPAAFKSLQGRLPKRPLQTIPLAVNIPENTLCPRPALLADLPANTLLLGAFGHSAPSKRFDVILAAVAQLRSTTLPFRLVLVGEPIAEYDVTAMIAQNGLDDIVIQTGFVTQADYDAYLHHIDIGINLRTQPTGGEMSASLLDLLAHGKPVLISDVDGFHALPETAVCKIPQDDTETHQLAATLTRLMQDAALRQQIGQTAKEYVQTQCNFPETARQMGEFLQVCWQTAVHGANES